MPGCNIITGHNNEDNKQLHIVVVQDSVKESCTYSIFTPMAFLPHSPLKQFLPPAP